MILKNCDNRIRYTNRNPIVWLLVVCAIFISHTQARAALDLHLNTPYNMEIVLHFREHRVFTSIFRDRTQRQVRDLLRLQMGELATVDVVSQHAKLPAILAKGLRQGLDDWNEFSDAQTHFVLLSFQKGVYHISSRFHDGRTGLNSPVVRKSQTRDRLLVARTIVDVIQSQFATVGTIDSSDQDLRMAIQGGQLNSGVSKWVKPGDVFAVVRMRETGATVSGRKMDWALVQVTDAPKNGWCRCRYYHRYPADELTIGGATAGYRCLQLPTSKLPLRLKLIHADSFQPLSGWEIHVRDTLAGKNVRQLTTDSAGIAQTADLFSNMVIAQVVKGKTIWAQLPIEMTSDRVVVCRVKPVEGAEVLALWEVRRDSWVNRLYDSLYAAGERLAEVNRQVPVSLEAALATAKAGAQSLADDIFTFTAQRDRLAVAARQQKLPIEPSDFEEGDQRLDDLQERHKLFDRLATKLQLALKQTEENKALSKQVVKARLLENQGYVDQALAIYDRVLKKAPKRAEKIRHHLQTLRKAWKIQSPQHRKAREFIYDEWPHLKIDELPKHLPIAKKWFAVCKMAGDRFSIRKLEIVNMAHAVRLKKKLDVLKQKDTPDNRAKAKIIAGLATEFRRLHAEVRAFLKDGEN